MDPVFCLTELYGILVRGNGKLVVTAEARHDLLVASSRQRWDLTTEAQGEGRSSDITYFATEEDRMYLAPQNDLFRRQGEGWCMRLYMWAGFVTGALSMAWLWCRLSSGSIFLADLRSQSCSHGSLAPLMGYGLRGSMSRTQACWVNASTESLCRAPTVARLYRKWLAISRSAMDEAVHWSTFSNHRRIRLIRVCFSPRKFETNWPAVHLNKVA
jgi:transposase InsO family protein